MEREPASAKKLKQQQWSEAGTPHPQNKASPNVQTRPSLFVVLVIFYKS